MKVDAPAKQGNGRGWRASAARQLFNAAYGLWDVNAEGQRTWCGRGKMTGRIGAPLGLTEDDDCDVDGAEDTELVGFLEEAILALMSVVFGRRR